MIVHDSFKHAKHSSRFDHRVVDASTGHHVEEADADDRAAARSRDIGWNTGPAIKKFEINRSGYPRTCSRLTSPLRNRQYSAAWSSIIEQSQSGFSP